MLRALQSRYQPGLLGTDVYGWLGESKMYSKQAVNVKGLFVAFGMGVLPDLRIAFLGRV
jgi:hypothetical protein